MRALMIFLAILAVAGCAPRPDTGADTIREASESRTSAQLRPPVLKAPSPPSATDHSHRSPAPSAPVIRPRPELPLAYHRIMSQGVGLSLVCFDDRQYQLRVADQPAGPGSKWMTAKSAASTHNGVAAINGGFFTPEGKPLGLLRENGTKRGHLNHSSLGAGIYISSTSGSAIIRRESYPTSPIAAGAEQLLQTGPMLVEHGKAVTGLSADKNRPRSIILWDGGHHWAIGYADSCSLAALASALSQSNVRGFKVIMALNLDGGRSSDLWVGPQVRGGNQTQRSFLNKPVRNYLVLTAR